MNIITMSGNEQIQKQIKQASDDWQRLSSYRSAFAYVFLPDSGNTILHYGCGGGYHTLLWIKKGNKVIGIDINEKSIAEAKEKFARHGISFYWSPDGGYHLEGKP